MNNQPAKRSRWRIAIAALGIGLFFSLSLATLLLSTGTSVAEGDITPTDRFRSLATVVVTAAPPTPTATPEAEEVVFESVAELMDFLADDDPYLGPADAPVVIVEFSDYACPFCGKFYLDTLPLILEAYPDDVKYVHRDYPIFGDVSFQLAISVDCALEQDRFWEMHESYLAVFSDFDPAAMGHGGPPSGENGDPPEPGGHDARFDYYTEEQILELAAEAGVELESFTTCMVEQRYAEEVYLDYQVGAQIGIQAVPFFIINGQVVNGAQPFEVFQQVIEQSLADQ